MMDLVKNSCTLEKRYKSLTIHLHCAKANARATSAKIKENLRMLMCSLSFSVDVRLYFVPLLLFLRPIHIERKKKRQLKFSLMLVVYSLNFFACSLIFFDFDPVFVRCEQALM